MCDGRSWLPGKGVMPHQFETQTAMSSQHSISDAGSVPPSEASAEALPKIPESLARTLDVDVVSISSTNTSRNSSESFHHNSGASIQMDEYRSPSSNMGPQPGGDSSGSAGVDAEGTEAGGEWIEACCNCLGDVCQFMCSMVFPACDD
jgi:hypothetical protein